MTGCATRSRSSRFAAAMRRMPFVVALVLFAATQSSYAADKTWDGGGTTANFGTAANWDLDVLPADGDTRHFGTGTKLTLTNDLAAFSWNFPGIIFDSGSSSFILTGNGEWGPYGMTNFSVNEQTYNLEDRLQMKNISICCSNGDITFGGAITSGGTPPRNLLKSGAYRLRLSSSSALAITALTNLQGVIELNQSVAAAIPDVPIAIGDSIGSPPPPATIKYTGTSSDMIGQGTTTPLIINRTGVLDFNSCTDTVGAVTLYGTNDTCGVITNSSTVGGALTLYGPNFIGGGRIDSGGGTARLYGGRLYYTTNTVPGIGQAAVMTGIIDIGNANPYYFSVSNDVALDVEMNISGVLVNDNNYILIGGLVGGGGALELSGTNTYGGATHVDDGILLAGTNAPAAGNGAFGNSSGGTVIICRWNNSPIASGAVGIGTYGAVTIGRAIQVGYTAGNFAGRYTLGGYSGDSSIFSGTITLGRSTHLFAASNNTIVTFSGDISGAYNITNVGPGTVVFSGTTKTYSGSTTITGGTLRIDCAMTNSSTASILVTNNGTLGGFGPIQYCVTNASGGHIAPGDGGIGSLTNYSLTVRTNSYLDIEFNGTTNDTVVVTNSGGLTMNGGSVNLYNVGTNTAWSTAGTYNLIKYNGATNGSISSLSVANPAPGATYTFGASGGWVTLTIGLPTVDNDGGASNITATTAILDGTLTATGGVPVTLYFFYGTTDGGAAWGNWNYTNLIAGGDGGVASPVVITNYVSGLSPSTKYYYTFYATNSVGQNWAGPSANFTTLLDTDNYGCSMQISFTNYNRAETLTNFPALVVFTNNMSGGTFKYSDFASTNGWDLRFLNSNLTTVLNYEIDQWATNGSSYVWVQVPQFYSNCCVWAYWKNSSAASAPAVYTTNGATWDSSYVLVNHLNKTNTSGVFLDSTCWHSDGTNVGGTLAAGKIGNAVSFDSSGSQLINCGDRAIYNNSANGITNALTMECWFNDTSFHGGSPNIILSRENTRYYLELFLNPNGAWYPGFCVGNNSDAPSSTPTFNNSQWYYMAGTWDLSYMRLYTNGTAANAPVFGTAHPNTSGNLYFGKGTGGGLETFCGLLDEVRFSSVARSSNWLGACYLNQAANSSFVGYSNVVSVTAPTVTSSPPSATNTTGATLNGNVTADGGDTVTDRGFCYKTSTGVTISDNKTTVSGTTGAYTLPLSSLNVNAQYYFKAYAMNSVGTKLSSPELSFWTLANTPSAPTVNGATATSLNVAVNENGNPGTTTYAIYETTQGKYVQGDGTLGGSTVWQTAATWGTKTVTGLNSGATYTFEVKALNGAGVETAFGATADGATSAAAPTVTSSAATSTNTTAATLNGNVSSDGGSAVTDRGFCYKTSSGVTISDNKTTVSGTTGAYTLPLSSLSVNAQYYFKAYAINSVGTTLSSPELSFWTLANTPSAPTVNGATVNSLNVTVNENGNPGATTYAIYETTQGKYVQGDGTLGASAVWQTAATWGTKTVTGLNSGATYTFEVKAQNGGATATGFGATADGATSVGPPTVTSSAATSTNTTSATLNGNVVADGGGTVTDRGFCYKTASGVTISDNKTQSGSGTGAYTLPLSSLSVNAQYWFKAYAINSAGTNLSSPELSFWTLANTPSAPTVNGATVNSLNVTVNENGNPGTTTYAIYETTQGKYVQGDGTLGASAVWQIAATWGTKTVTGLNSGATYTFEVKAQNGAGVATAFGATANGTTSAGAPAVDNDGGASNVTTTTAILDGTLISTGGVPVTLYFFYGTNDGGAAWGNWGYTNNIGGLGGGTNVPVVLTNAVSGLSAGTLYYYRFYATNSGGQAWATPVTNFTTPSFTNAYPYKMKITFSGYNRAETLTNFPALVVFSNNMNNSGFNYSQFGSTNGWDLRFNNSNETVSLNYEVEKWATNASSYVWVQVTNFCSNCYIWAYWGNTNYSATNAAAVYTTNGATWDSTFRGVWHLSTNTTPSLDSTAYHNNGTVNGVVSNSAGQVIDGADKFYEEDGDDYVEIANSVSLENVQEDNYSMEAWFNPRITPPGVDPANDASWGIFEKPGRHEGLSFNNSRMFIMDHWLASGPSDGGVGSSSVYATSQWHHAVGVVDRTNGFVKIYVDGQLQGSNGWAAGSATYEYNQLTLKIGCANPGAGTYRWAADGMADEVRIENIVRTANWIWACYMNQASNSAFCGYGGVTGPGATFPTIDNDGGASNITVNSAILEGTLTSTGGAPVTLYFFYGTNDGGAAWGGWRYTNNIGGLGGGTNLPVVFANTVTNLSAGTKYYYRFHATNSYGQNWATPATSFTTLASSNAPVGVNVGLNFMSEIKSMNASDSAGAVVAATNWNNLTGVNGSAASITDSTGSVSGITVVWSGFEGTYSARGSATNGDEKMMWGYCDNTAGNALIAVSNITASYYDVYAYFGSDSDGRTGTIGINGANTYSFATYSGARSFPGSYTVTSDTGTGYPSANYAVWSNLTASSFTMTMVKVGNNNGLNGLQLVVNGAQASSSPAINNGIGATNLTATSAWLNANLTSTGGLPTTVRLYWDTSDKGTSSTSSWAYVYDFGAKAVGVYSNQATSLSPATVYFYRAWATNSAGQAWASASSFTTWGPPTINNDSGAANVTTNSATLRGQLLSTGGQSTEVYVFWGTSDGGTVQGAWSYNNYLGVNGAGAVSTNVAGLSSNTMYCYRFYATNISGGAWASSTTNFTTPASNLRNLIVTTDGNGSVDVTNGWFVYGSNVLVTATPNPGYRFASWSGDTNGCSFPGANSISVYIDGTRQIVAHFTEFIINNDIVGLNFGSNKKTLAASDSAGAVVASSNWNNLANGSGSASSIVNSTGGVSGITVDWNFPGTWNARSSSTNGDEKMMYGYLDNNTLGGDVGTPWPAHIAVSNITASSYDVYVYFGAGLPGKYVTTGIDGTNTYALWQMSIDTNSFPRDYTPATSIAGIAAVTNGANYAVWSNLTASSFVITHTVFQGICNGGVAGVQVVPAIVTVPTPSGTVFMIR
jgi:autotransporter-associated beta strand protein